MEVEDAIKDLIFNEEGNCRGGITAIDEQCIWVWYKDFSRVSSFRKPRRGNVIFGYGYGDYMFDGEHWHFIGSKRPMLKPDSSPEDFEAVLEQLSK